MIEHAEPAELPPVTTMDRGRQLRLLGVIVAAAVVLVLVVIGAQSFFHHEATPPAPPPPGTLRLSRDQMAALTTMRVGTGANDEQTGATGTITVDGDQSTPVLLPYSGQVVRVLVDAGERVKKGQPLLVIKTTDFVEARGGLLSARSALLASQAQVAAAQRNADRQKQIYETAGGALKDYQQAQTDLVAAQTAERTAEAALGGARDKLAILGQSTGEISQLENSSQGTGIHDETTLLAPIGGVIATRDVSPGQYVSTGGDKPVMTITDPSRVWLIAQIAETDVALVHVGDPVDVTTPALPGRIFHATLDMVAEGLDPQTHRLPVRAQIANPDNALKPQMFASFAIRRSVGGTAIHVPAAAVIHEGDTSRVWLVRADGLLEARQVTTGETRDGQVEILSGLRSGERIVTAGALFVNEAGLGA